MNAFVTMAIVAAGCGIWIAWKVPDAAQWVGAHFLAHSAAKRVGDAAYDEEHARVLAELRPEQKEQRA